MVLGDFPPERRLRISPRVRQAVLPAHGGFRVDRADCSGLKIGIVDTGAPAHRDIKLNEHSRQVSMIDGEEPYDRDGHGTSVSGILSSSHASGIPGLCHEATFFHAKCAKSDRSGDISALVGGLLWCMAFQCDMVVCSLTSSEEEHLASEVIKKLLSKDILIFSAVPDTHSYAFPSSDSGVISVVVGGDGSPSAEGIRIAMPNWTYDTMTVGDRFMDSRGSSFANAFVAGVAANMIASGSDADPRGIVAKMMEI